MTFTSLLPYIQVVLSVLAIIAILIQKSDSSVGGAFGGGSDNWSAAYHTRRGFEKITFNITIVLVVLFAVFSFIALFLK